MRRRVKKVSPLYERLADDLKQEIHSGEFSPGDMLPSEASLCQQYGVSRGTVVRAFDILLREGMAQRRQGVGTIVARQSLHRKPGYLLSFTAGVRQQGRVPAQQFIDIAPLSRKKAMQFGCDESAVVLERLRLVGNIPWAIHKHIVPHSVACRIDELQLDINQPHAALLEEGSFSLFDAFQNVGIIVDHADEILHAQKAGRKEAQLLQIQEGDAVMLVHRKSFDTKGRLLEITEGIYSGESYTYEVHLISSRGLSEALFAHENKQSS